MILAVFATVVCVDQVSKAIIMATIPDQQHVFVSADQPRFFQFTHQRNPGLVGGMFRHHPTMAYTAPVLATLVLLYLYRHLDPRSKLQSLAYGLIGGGAVGNLIDRIRLGSVTDFLQFYFYFVPFNFPWKYYPAFNAADSSICTGVFLLMISWYVMGKDHAPDSV